MMRDINKITIDLIRAVHGDQQDVYDEIKVAEMNNDQLFDILEDLKTWGRAYYIAAEMIQWHTVTDTCLVGALTYDEWQD